jgi:hypothetical protein
MPANIDPIYVRAPDVQAADAVIGPTANTAQDGTSSASSMHQVAQADSVNGSFIKRVRFQPVGSPAATVARIFLCSVTGAFTMGTSNTAANTFLVGEVQLPAVTLSQTVPAQPVDFVLNEAIPAGWRVLVSFGTSTGAAGTGYRATMFGGKY